MPRVGHLQLRGSWEMRYTPIFVPAILALLIIAVTIYKSPTRVNPAPYAMTSMPACHDNQPDCAFLQSLEPILRNTKRILAFKFPEPCRKCHEANLTQRELPDVPAKILLSAEDVSFFRTKFSDQKSYIFGIQKAMPFFADYGFVLDGTDGKTTLLLSTFSKSVRLVTDKPDPVLLTNIDPLFPDLTGWLARLFAETKTR